MREEERHKTFQAGARKPQCSNSQISILPGIKGRLSSEEWELGFARNSGREGWVSTAMEGDRVGKGSGEKDEGLGRPQKTWS